MFEDIHTQRLVLRDLTLEDAETLLRYRQDPEVARYQSWRIFDLDGIRRFILSHRNLAPNTEDSWYQVAIADRKGNQLLGDLGLHFPNGQREQAEIGITLAPWAQGRGLAQEALTAALDYYFVGLKKHRVYASVDPRNTPCTRLLERVGMRKEAHHIESYFADGEWTDDVIYALLRREWLAKTQE